MEFEEFLRVNEDRIHFMIHRLGIKGDWYGDFYAEGLVTLWRAYQEFDDVKGNVGTFLNYRIRYRLIDLLRKKIREMEVDELVAEGIKREQLHGNRHRATQVEIIDCPELPLQNDMFWQEVRLRLTPKQWKWVYYFIICDLSIKEIMEIENVSADAVKGWGRSVRARLRKDRVKDVLEGLI